MKKTIFKKAFFLLCTLLAGVVNAHAVNYEWVKTDFSDLQTGDMVVLVDEHLDNIALPNDDGNFEGVPVNVQGTKLSGTVSDDIQWKIRKNDNTVTFLEGNHPLLVTSEEELKVGGEGTSDFTYDDGKLRCTVNNTTYYILWWLAGSTGGDKYWARPTTNNNDLYLARFAFYKKVEVTAPKYVKWKMVDGSNVKVTNNDIVVIVDRNTGLALSNDKEDKDPAAVAVTLNYDKDRIIMDEVPENVQWVYGTVSVLGLTIFSFKTGDNYLYADGEKLKVGSGDHDHAFSKTTIDGIMYLKITSGGKDYLAGVEESMFSNTWKLKELKDGKPDDKVKNTRFAIFKKVEDEQTIPTVSFPSDNYEINVEPMNITNSASHLYNQYEKATCQEGYAVGHYSSNEEVAYPVGEFWTPSDPNGNQLVLLKRGTIKLIARVKETAEHDKADAVCTVRINDSRTDKGTKTNPLTPSEAIRLAKGEEVPNATFDEDRCYFIKGKVNKVNSGMMAMFGDMGLDEIMGDDMDMEERMGDMDDMDMSELGGMMGGMDLTSMIPGFANSEGLTYYISDNGTKENRLKVTDGRGLVTLKPTDARFYEKAEIEKLEDLSPGDDVLVYGPLVLTENNNMFASLLGGTGGAGGTAGIPGMNQSEYEWVPTNLFELNNDDEVLLVDKNKKFALKSNLASSSVKIKDDKIADDNKVSDDIKWALTKNDDGSVTFKKGDNPLSVNSNFELIVGQGTRSDFTYNSNLLGIEYPTFGRYCIKWDENNNAIFENLEQGSNTEADFTFYKKVKKTEDKGSVKVGELNYLHDIKRVLKVADNHMYENTTKNLSDNRDFFFTINDGSSVRGLIDNPAIPAGGTMKPAQVKSADEEIAKWVMIDENNENSDSLFTAVEKGKTKITVKVKVMFQEKTDDQDEISYTMKRKFQLEVLPRDKEPEGKNVGEYVLVKNVSELKDGTRLLIIGTRTKTDKEDTYYALGANNTMMGGGKEGKTVEEFSTSEQEGFEGRDCIKYEDVPDGVQEIILEQDEDGWRLNVGKDENGNTLYLYATEKKEKQTEDEEGFNFGEMMEMFMPSTGLKVGTIADAEAEDDEDADIVYSLKANISISEDIATISFVGLEGKKNTIMLASSFDMDSMMEMFGGMGQKENTGDETQTTEENSSSFNMGDFDMFMASFNTKKIGDETAEEGKDPKCFLPRIFGFVQYDEYPITVTSAEWKTIVSDYDVDLATGLEAYIVTRVTYDKTKNQCVAKLKPVSELRGGEPYLLHSSSGEFILKRKTGDEPVPVPNGNLLKVSTRDITGQTDSESTLSPYFLLNNKNNIVGFYRWVGGVLGKGRVYLEVTDETLDETGGLAKAVEFCAFEIDNTTAISEIEQSESETKRYYNLSGQRVTKPIQKGVYVVNGKTVVVK